MLYDLKEELNLEWKAIDSSISSGGELPQKKKTNTSTRNPKKRYYMAGAKFEAGKDELQPIPANAIQLSYKNGEHTLPRTMDTK